MTTQAQIITGVVDSMVVDTAMAADNIPFDSLASDTSLTNDSLMADSLALDTILSPDAVESKVHSIAKDSSVLDMTNGKIWLYGEAVVTYENIELRAEIIELDMDSNLVCAYGRIDSLGNEIGRPVFKEGDQEFRSREICYNFETEKGKINEVITQEGEGHIHGEYVVKTKEDIIYIKNGKYTTCEHDNPHYSIAAKKLKIIPNKKIITGPANLVIEDVPTPIFVPFGLFPYGKNQKSGILIPSFGESQQRGFFLQEGGYYFAISDRTDLALRGDIFSNGSYKLNGLLRYKRRYRFNGNLNVSQSSTKTGVIREDPSFTEVRDFFVKWSHNQDAKARPGTRFSGWVNAGTNTNFSNDINSTTEDFLKPEFSSNIAYSKSFAGTPFNLSINGRHTQNTQSEVISITLPEATFSVNRFFPFKSKNSTSGGALSNIGTSLTTNFKNQLTVQDSLISIGNSDFLLDTMKNGVQNVIPLSANFKLLKFFTLNPSINYRNIIYFDENRQSYNAEDSSLVTEKVENTSLLQTWNFNTNLTTKLYGIRQFKKGATIKAIRHVLTPSVGFTYTPEYNAGTAFYKDTTGEKEYNRFNDGIYGTLNRNESSSLNFGLLNNLEMKVKSKKDTTGEGKKIKIFEALQFSSSYDMIKDSLNWTNVAISGRTNLTKNINFQMRGSLSPYVITEEGTKINRSYWKENQSIGVLETGSFTLGLNFSSQDAKKKDRQTEDEEDQADQNGNRNEFFNENANFDVPWTFRANYNLNYTRANNDDVTQTLDLGGDLNLTTKWKVGFTSGWDFEQSDIAYTSINIFRDLHCWQMRFNWIPTGQRQSYTFTIQVKASILQDLKLDKKGNSIQ